MDEDTRNLSLAASIIGLSLMSGLIITILVAICRIYKRFHFRFIILLLFLMICSDFSLGVLSVCFYYEGELSVQK